MALIAPQSPLVAISGSVGGEVFSKDLSGLHVCCPKRFIQTRSPLQDRRRRAFLTALHAWHQAVAAGYAELWKMYAGRHPSKGRLGRSVILSGYQMFMRYNIYRAYNNISDILLPPEG